MKDIEFFTQSPSLSGDEVVLARAGQGVEDPWVKENQNPGILGFHPLDEKGKVTPMYKKILKELGFKGPVKRYGINIKPSKEIEEANLKWREIQKEKKKLITQASQHIEEQHIVADNRKLEVLETLRLDAEFRRKLDRKLLDDKESKKSKTKKSKKTNE